MATGTERLRFLPFLTPAEEASLIASAPAKLASTDELILDQNILIRAIYFIEEGSVRVERHDEGQIARLATLVAGECFGEMSYVDGGPTSARVVADEPTKLRIIGDETMAKMTKADPSFMGRLYHSIAAILSERLRLTSSHLDTLIAGIDFYSGVKADMEAALAKLPGPDWRTELVSVMVQKEGKA